MVNPRCVGENTIYNEQIETKESSIFNVQKSQHSWISQSANIFYYIILAIHYLTSFRHLKI